MRERIAPKLPPLAMSWVIEPDPPEAWMDGADLHCWTYFITRDGHRRKITAALTGTAMVAADVPERVRLARETEGRSEVEAALSLNDPPRRIVLDSSTA